MFIATLLTLVLSPATSIYQSHMHVSSLGYEFEPRNSIQLIMPTSFSSRLRCSSACNQRSSCRAFDYDSASSRCRLFEGDLTTGSIVPSLFSTSIAGYIIYSPSLFMQSHNQSCGACQDSRYEQCSATTNTCHCGLHAFWKNSVCSLQLFDGDACSQIDACRADLNLTCVMDFPGQFSNCSSSTYYNR